MAPVKVCAVRVAPIAEMVEGHGVIKPFPKNDVKLSAVSPLRVSTIYVKPGDRVKKGQRVIKLQRDQSQDMAVRKAKIAMEQASINLKRAQKLFDSGVIARVKLEQAQTEFNLAKADYELEKRSLQYAIENSILLSPIDGVVSSVNGVVGQVADPSQVLAHIINTRRIIASIGVETEDIEKIKTGQRAEITIPNLSDGKVFAGRVIKQNKEIDPETQLIHIWIELANPRRILQPGMFAVAHIFVNEEPKALIVPRSAVLGDYDGYYVYVVEKDTARKVAVKPGIITDNKAQILQGLRIGQTVVYLGNYELENGMKVMIKKKE
ncbi:MAG: efflux RND transporter periplasmic adaptor subunit [Calditrichaeota bacterium]|nr:efflux RND transporter periplasmic adaptor subunit [Calditrichota bacterium]